MAQNLIKQIECTIDAIDLEPNEKACRVVAQLVTFLDLDPSGSIQPRSHFGQLLEAHRSHLGSKLKAELDEYINTFLTEEENVYQH